MADSGEMVRPWCPATRLLDQRELDTLNAKAEAAKKAGMTDSRLAEKVKPLREGFPPLEVTSQHCVEAGREAGCPGDACQTNWQPLLRMHA